MFDALASSAKGIVSKLRSNNLALFVIAIALVASVCIVVPKLIEFYMGDVAVTTASNVRDAGEEKTTGGISFKKNLIESAELAKMVDENGDTHEYILESTGGQDYRFTFMLKDGTVRTIDVTRDPERTALPYLTLTSGASSSPVTLRRYLLGDSEYAREMYELEKPIHVAGYAEAIE